MILFEIAFYCSYLLSPDDITSNEILNVTVDMTLQDGETVTGGTIKLKVQSNGYNIFTSDFDLCQELSQVGLSCPLSPGNYHVFKQIDIPFIPYGGNLNATAQMYDQSNTLLVCMSVSGNVNSNQNINKKDQNIHQ